MSDLKDIKDFRHNMPWLSVGGPIFALLIAIATAGYLLLADFAQEQDAEYARKTSLLVDRAIQERTASLATLTSDYTDWDAAYQAISVKWDQAWVEQNMYMVSVDASMIYRPGMGVRYSYTTDSNKEHLDNALVVSQLPEIERLVDRVLAKPIEAGQSSASTVANVGGELAIIYISAFRPTQINARADLGERPKDVAIVVSFLNRARLNALASAIDVQQLRFQANSISGKLSASVIGLPVKNSLSQSIGLLVWKHQKPGTAAFQTRWPVILAGLTLLGVLSFLVSAILVRSQLKLLTIARKTAEAASRIKSEFLANMSHELRTPLNSVIGYAEIIEEDAVAGTTQSTASDAVRIKKSAKHLLSLINDILDHSKIEAGKMEIHPELVDLPNILEDVVESLCVRAQENNVELKSVCDPLIGAAMLDPVRFKQCLLNLASNAVKFTKGGRVTISLRGVKLPEGDFVRATIADTGIGMSEEALSRLFQPFEQADSSTTRDYGGTGLGLAITKKLIEAMGGSVRAESTLGKGSTFVMLVPRGCEGVVSGSDDQPTSEIAA